MKRITAALALSACVNAERDPTIEAAFAAVEQATGRAIEWPDYSVDWYDGLLNGGPHSGRTDIRVDGVAFHITRCQPWTVAHEVCHVFSGIVHDDYDRAHARREIWDALVPEVESTIWLAPDLWDGCDLYMPGGSAK